MSLLDDFDEPVNFQPPDKNFYQKLKKIKWNNGGKKLFWKLYDIRGAINLRRWGTETDVFESGENFALTFLAACNAVHQDRDKMLEDDVVRAYKTYLKLLNTDISKLEV
jgi:hypothetical protein